jgi:alanyl-tRNA synthetase
LEVAYVVAGRLIERFRNFCLSRGVPFQLDTNIRPYDESTLFCPAGMQQFKAKFRDPDYRGTIANIQACLRLSDLDEIGDGTHLLHFDMMGLFSFREMSVKDAVVFWFDFLSEIELPPDTTTIHPDKMDEWRSLYDGRDVTISSDPECTWTDGAQGGYCTEFYLRGVEIGNIVNTGGDCIDAGFGLDRLLFMLGDEAPDGLTVLQRGVMKIIDSGYRPGNKQQGYVLRRLLRQLARQGGSLDHPFFEEEQRRQEKLMATFERLWPKHRTRPKEWWLDTHGIELDEALAASRRR